MARSRQQRKTGKATQRGKRLGFAVVGIGLAIGWWQYQQSAPTESSPQPGATYDLAMRYLGDHRVDEAEQVLLEVLARRPESMRVRDELRWMYFNQFRKDDLEAVLEEGLQVQPHNFAWAVALVMSEFRPQNPREIVGFWERAARKQPHQPRVQATLGYCYARVGQLGKAKQAFQAASDSAPNDPLVRLRTIEFLCDTGRWSSAQQLLEMEDSGDEPAKRYDDRFESIRGLSAEARGDLAAALAHWERALARRPRELSYVQGRGRLLQRLGRSEEAEEAFRTANELESYVSRLTEIVLSGALDKPTPGLCREIAELCERRGKKSQAEAWRRAAVHVQSLSAAGTQKQ